MNTSDTVRKIIEDALAEAAKDKKARSREGDPNGWTIGKLWEISAPDHPGKKDRPRGA